MERRENRIKEKGESLECFPLGEASLLEETNLKR